MVDDSVSPTLLLVLSTFVAFGGVLFAVIVMSEATDRSRGVSSAMRIGLVMFLALVAIDFVVFGFANVYRVTSIQHPASFSEPVSKLTSVYMAVGTLTTSGLGSVAANSERARALVMVQMAVDFVVLATMVTLVASAIVAKNEPEDPNRQ